MAIFILIQKNPLNHFSSISLHVLFALTFFAGIVQKLLLGSFLLEILLRNEYQTISFYHNLCWKKPLETFKEYINAHVNLEINRSKKVMKMFHFKTICFDAKKCTHYLHVQYEILRPIFNKIQFGREVTPRKTLPLLN